MELPAPGSGKLPLTGRVGHSTQAGTRSLLKDKRFLILLLLLISICLMFWGSSRYPALDSKAQMAGDLNLEDQLSFDVWITHSTDESTLQTVGITFLNWLHTNRQGMLFGIALAVVLMSTLPVFKQHIQYRPGERGSGLAGFAIGAPLGVCVNCAAPIAFGLYKRGARAELAIATMISSPVFNVIVVSMLITLFAWPLVIIKLTLTLLVIFAIVPLLLRLFPSETYTSETSSATDSHTTETDYKDNRMVPAGFWVINTLLVNAKYLALKVIPVMLLAGLIGSLIVTVVPWDALSFTRELNGIPTIAGALLLLSVFGLLLPVPIAFDVIIAVTLLNAGIPVAYVAVLLFTLGTFSVYSFMVLWQAGARKVASCLVVCLILCGVVAGVSSHVAMKWYKNLQQQRFYSQLQSDTAIRHQVAGPVAGLPGVKAAVANTYKPHPNHSNLQIMSLHTTSTAESTNWHMERATDSGFLYHPKSLIEQMSLPFVQLNSLAAGDTNNDRWIDLVAGSSRGPYLYTNTGGRFVSTALSFQAEYQRAVGALGLVDINNDGFLDLYFDQAYRGTFISYNDKGNFQEPVRLGGDPQVTTTSAAFADLDGNGEIDIIEGYHSGANGFLESPAYTVNRVYMQFDGVFTSKPLPGPPAATLSILISDISGSGRPDILVGNDFDPPDTYYRVTPDGQPVHWKNKAITTTHTTMSIDSADIDNDLQLETYHAQVTRNPASPPAIIPVATLADSVRQECAESLVGELQQNRCDAFLIRLNGIIRHDNDRCARLLIPHQFDCLAAHWFFNGVLNKDPDSGNLLDKWYPDYAALYRRLAPSFDKQKIPASDEQKKGKNLLYKNLSGETNAQSAEIAEQLGVDITGWSWNARFADLDGDQWQDLFVANGWRFQQIDTSNLWFKNQKGEQLIQRTSEAGLQDFNPTLSSVYIDTDNDGDLDIVTFGIDGGLILYSNNDNANRHLQIELEDTRGNRSGLGAKIIVRTPDGTSQIREVKASGGYLSQDPGIVHFGLGTNDTVDEILVNWPDGNPSQYVGPFKAQQRILIERQAGAQ